MTESQFTNALLSGEGGLVRAHHCLECNQIFLLTSKSKPRCCPLCGVQIFESGKGSYPWLMVHAMPEDVEIANGSYKS